MKDLLFSDQSHMCSSVLTLCWYQREVPDGGVCATYIQPCCGELPVRLPASLSCCRIGVSSKGNCSVVRVSRWGRYDDFLPSLRQQWMRDVVLWLGLSNLGTFPRLLRTPPCFNFFGFSEIPSGTVESFALQCRSLVWEKSVVVHPVQHNCACCRIVSPGELYRKSLYW